MIDDFSFSGTPVKLKLEALALPADSSFKETQRTKTYEKTTLENIGQEVAKRAGIKLYYEAPRIPIEKVEQSEKDDCSFYNELVKLYGFAMKIYKNKIVVFNEATYEKKKSVATLTEQNIEPNWSWNTKLCRTYTGAKYEYTNNDKNQTIKVEVGGGNRILKVTDAASNASEAERITLAKINEANKGDTTMSVTMTRANRKIIATSCVTIKGFGKLDGKYYVEKVTWDIGSGCKQKLDGDKVLHSDYHGNEVHRNADTSKGRKVHTDHYEKGLLHRSRSTGRQGNWRTPDRYKTTWNIYDIQHFTGYAESNDQGRSAGVMDKPKLRRWRAWQQRQSDWGRYPQSITQQGKPEWCMRTETTP